MIGVDRGSRRIVRAALLTSLMAAAGSVAYAQGAGVTVWSGVYTDEQATRGKATYDAVCAACHGATLGGGDVAPALSGGTFLNNWNATSAGDLFERIHSTMPQSDPGSLSGRQVADIEAYMFQSNGFPAGTNALAAGGPEQAGVKIVATKP